MSRPGIPERLRADLPKVRERGMVAFGSGTTDPYQPCEADLPITAACAELLADQKRILGPDHPHTLTTRHNLAWWRAQAGDPGALRAITAKKKQQDADRARAVAAAVPTP